MRAVSDTAKSFGHQNDWDSQGSRPSDDFYHHQQTPCISWSCKRFVNIPSPLNINHTIHLSKSREWQIHNPEDQPSHRPWTILVTSYFENNQKALSFIVRRSMEVSCGHQGSEVSVSCSTKTCNTRSMEETWRYWGQHVLGINTYLFYLN